MNSNQDQDHPECQAIHPIATPRLNHDILFHIAEMSDRPTIGRLMRTCRFLHFNCAKYVFFTRAHFGRSAVSLSQQDDIERFMRFMEPYDMTRWSYLTALNITVKENLDLTTTQSLSLALRHAVNVEDLEVYEASELFGPAQTDRQIALFRALSALPNVKRFVARGASLSTCLMLEEMQWPLQSARLTAGSGEFWYEPGLTERLHPISILKNARMTLESLFIRSWPPCTNELNSAYITYPNMRCVDIMDVFFPPIIPWVASCPRLDKFNAHHIHSNAQEGHMNDVSEDDLADFQEQHLYNVEQQLVHGSWPRLLNIEGSVFDIYCLGITCRISTLTLIPSPVSLPFVPEIVALARPVSLKIQFPEDLPPSNVAAILCHPGLQELEDLLVYAYEDLPGKYFHKYFEIILDAFAAATRLSTLCFVLHTIYPALFWPPPREIPSPPGLRLPSGAFVRLPERTTVPYPHTDDLPMTSTENYVFSAEFHSLAAGAFNALQSLTKFVLDLEWSSGPRNGKKVTTVYRDGRISITSSGIHVRSNLW